ncbi:hypothetical protein ACTSKR_16400 [Chitinibacteraceae bacterium HSL-7]
MKFKLFFGLPFFPLVCFGGGVNDFVFEKSGRYSVDLTWGADSRVIYFSHEVFAYEVNCKKDRALVWGKGKKVQVGTAPYSGVTLVSLRPFRVLKTFTVTRGPYSVEYQIDGKYVYIDGEYWVSLDTGERFDNVSIYSDPEVCGNFKFRFLNKINQGTGEFIVKHSYD